MGIDHLLKELPRVIVKDPSEKLFPENPESPLVAHLNVLNSIYRGQPIDEDSLGVVVKEEGSKVTSLEGHLADWNTLLGFITRKSPNIKAQMAQAYIEMLSTSWEDKNREKLPILIKSFLEASRVEAESFIKRIFPS